MRNKIVVVFAIVAVIVIAYTIGNTIETDESKGKEIAIYFCDSFISEDTMIFPSQAGIFYASTEFFVKNEKLGTTLSELYAQGWILRDAVKTNASAQIFEMLLFMER
jgi:hypothetical protein